MMDHGELGANRAKHSAPFYMAYIAVRACHSASASVRFAICSTQTVRCGLGWASGLLVDILLSLYTRNSQELIFLPVCCQSVVPDDVTPEVRVYKGLHYVKAEQRTAKRWQIRSQVKTLASYHEKSTIRRFCPGTARPDSELTKFSS